MCEVCQGSGFIHMTYLCGCGPTWHDRSKESLEYFRNLPDGWDGDTALAPTAKAVESANLILDYIAKCTRIVPHRVAPTMEGGIVIYVNLPLDLLVIHIDAEGEITY